MMHDNSSSFHILHPASWIISPDNLPVYHAHNTRFRFSEQVGIRIAALFFRKTHRDNVRTSPRSERPGLFTHAERRGASRGREHENIKSAHAVPPVRPICVPHLIPQVQAWRAREAVRAEPDNNSGVEELSEGHFAHPCFPVAPGTVGHGSAGFPYKKDVAVRSVDCVHGKEISAEQAEAVKILNRRICGRSPGRVPTRRAIEFFKSAFLSLEQAYLVSRFRHVHGELKIFLPGYLSGPDQHRF